MDLSKRPVLSYSKDHQTRGNRVKPTRRTRSEASPEVRKQVHDRSGRACEKCDRARATQLAHIERRWKSEGKPTALEFTDLCVPCHAWCDSGEEGRKWLLDFQDRLIQKTMREAE